MKKFRKEFSVPFIKIIEILMKSYLKKSKLTVETFKIIYKQSPNYLHDLISIKDKKAGAAE